MHTTISLNSQEAFKFCPQFCTHIHT